MRPHRVALLLLPLAVVVACGRGDPAPAAQPDAASSDVREGYVTVPGGRVWYRIAGRANRTPLLLLHGGPGVPSHYLTPLLALADERPVIIYDQLGAGRSDQPADTSLWHTERFVRELQAVRDSLGLHEVYLYGHSWGTMLAAAYLEGKPRGVRGVIFASPCLSAARWTADADSLIRLLPDSTQQAIAAANRTGAYDTPAYQAAIAAYYARHVSRLPATPHTDSAVAHTGTAVYAHMWGPSEFRATGNLKDFDATPRLGALTMPTLFTAGEFDEATPAATRYYASLVPGSEVQVIGSAAHMTMNDNPIETVRGVREWLRRIDTR